MKKVFTIAAAVTAFTMASAHAETVKIGYMTTLSGKAGIIGKQMQNAVELALEHKEVSLVGWMPMSFLLMISVNQMSQNSWPIA